MANEQEKATQEQQKELTTQQMIDMVKDKPEFAAILNQHGKKYLEIHEVELGKKAMGKGWKQVDDAVLSAMGLEERPEGMNTSQYAGHLATEYKKLLDKVGNQEQQQKESTDKDQLHAAQLAKVNEDNEALRKQIAAFADKEYSTNIANNINSYLSDQTFKQSYSKDDLQELREIRTNSIIGRAKEVGGKTIFYNKTNEPYMNPNGLPMTAQEVAAVEFSSMFQVKKEGGNADDDAGKGKIKGDIVAIPNIINIKSFAQLKDEFVKVIQPKGWAWHEKRTKDLFKATQDHYFPNGLSLE